MTIIIHRYFDLRKIYPRLNDSVVAIYVLALCKRNLFTKQLLVILNLLNICKKTSLCSQFSNVFQMKLF